MNLGFDIGNITDKKIEKFKSATQEIFSKQASWRNEELIIKVNEDYPYIYTRDLAILINFLVEENQKQLALGAIKFLKKCQLQTGEWVQRYNENYGREEDKLQEDNTGLAIWAIMNYLERYGDNELSNIEKNLIEGINWIKNNLNDDFNLLYSHSSNHEDGINEGYELWTNSVSAKAIKMYADYFNDSEMYSLYRNIKNAIMDLLTWEGRFIRKIDKTGQKYLGPDVILISPYYFEIISQQNNYLLESLNYILDELQDKRLGGLWRYKEDVYFPGPWVIYTAIVSKCLFDADYKKRAVNLLEWIFSTAKDGKLPEHLVSKKEFEKNKKRQINRAKNMPVKKMKKVRLGIIKDLEDKFENNDVVGYSRPIMWSHIETSRALKKGGYIEEINFRI